MGLITRGGLISGGELISGSLRFKTIPAKCHACGSKTAISCLLTPAFPFLMPGGKV